MRAAALALAALLLPLAGAKGDGQSPGDKDYIDSPWVGNGVAPNGTTKVYVSAYLDRLLEVHQDDYRFRAKFYMFLSWQDESAYEAMTESTKEAAANNGTCSKLCNGQRAWATGVKCCADVWLPSMLSRNVMEYPQDRVQPYIIDVKPDGRVTWRTEVSGTWYTYLALRAFPFDRQRLTVNLALTNFNPAKSFVELVPSTSGTDIFTLGDGDTLSGWDVTDVWVEANPNKTFQSQFVPFRRDRSAPDDPSPLLPAGGGDEGAFGTDIVISSVQIVVAIKRLSLNFVFTVILPILFVTGVSFLALLVDPCSLSLRLTTVLTCMLTLLALVYLIDPQMPAASYMLPTKSLAVLSYGCLAVISVESLLVFELARRPHVRAAAAERAAALRAAAAARAASRAGTGAPSARWLDCLRPPPPADAMAAAAAGGSCRKALSFAAAKTTARRSIDNPDSPADAGGAASDGGERGLARTASGRRAGASAAGRRLESAYWQALARRVDVVTMAALGLLYAAMVATIFVVGQTANPAHRPPPPP